MSVEPTPILCEPAKDCADAHTLRWDCLRGHDGAPAGVCPLEHCEKRGANRSTTTEGTD